MMKPRKEISSHYEHRIGRKDLKNFEVLDWGSEESQQARFQILASKVSLENRSLLDVGCGLGDLWEYLKKHRITVNYTGVDLLPKMVQAAQKLHPDVRFVCGNLFDPSEELLQGERFDIVFCSGVFNLNLGNNLEFLAAAVSGLLQRTKEHLVVNLLHHRTPVQPPRYYYYDPEILSEKLLLPGWDITLVEDYLPNDFTLIFRKSG